MFLEYICDASYAISAGRFFGPWTSTSLIVTTSPNSVYSQFPPDGADRSIITLPGFICSTVDFSINIGAFLPGIAAVVMMASDFIMCGLRKSNCNFFVFCV